MFFPDQAPGFGPEFKNGQTRGIVNVQGRVVQILDLGIELIPFIVSELAIFYLFALDFADIDNQTVDELDIGHFQRKQSDWFLEIYRDVFSHRQHEGRLTHGRPGGDDYQVGLLPA
ncbi:MAG: hypothetical protein BWY72_02395 [Bacteroidetes bacterium ADurb.Bin416]|nr:MAG: hypothetical protein BWY72_02395 [Bacteroidetes bacterium ADurb.Bin416]